MPRIKSTLVAHPARSRFAKACQWTLLIGCSVGSVAARAATTPHLSGDCLVATARVSDNVDCSAIQPSGFVDRLLASAVKAVAAKLTSEPRAPSLPTLNQALAVSTPVGSGANVMTTSARSLQN